MRSLCLLAAPLLPAPCLLTPRRWSCRRPRSARRRQDRRFDLHDDLRSARRPISSAAGAARPMACAVSAAVAHVLVLQGRAAALFTGPTRLPGFQAVAAQGKRNLPAVATSIDVGRAVVDRAVQRHGLAGLQAVLLQGHAQEDVVERRLVRGSGCPG